jgi:hypothetical protein
MGFVGGILFALIVHVVSSVPSPWEIRIETLNNMIKATREREDKLKLNMEIRAIAREEIVKFHIRKEAE